MKIVNQFRALKETRLIFDTYRFNGQKFAASVFNDCIVFADDEKLLEMLRNHAFTFVNSLQSFAPETLPEWREFLIELINDVTAMAQFCYMYNKAELSFWFEKSAKLAALVVNEETEMNSKIQQTAKPRASADLGRMSERTIEKDIDELITNLKQACEQLAQMRDAAAKLRATINKSKKLIADWEC